MFPKGEQPKCQEGSVSTQHVDCTQNKIGLDGKTVNCQSINQFTSDTI